MKKVRNLIAVLIAVAVLFISAMPALATDEEVRSTSDGVLFFTRNIDGEPSTRGSCFLINEDTIITSNHCVKLTDEEYKYIYNTMHMKRSQVDKKLTYSVTIQSDLTIPAKLVNSSENMDFAILKLSQPISNHSFLKLRDSKTVQAAETVYSVGFPLSKDTTEYFNQKDIVFESGTLNRTQFTAEKYWSADSPFFRYKNGNPVEVYYRFKGDMFMMNGKTMSGGNSGGPLVDEQGNVIGICMAGSVENCYASAIDQVMEVCDTLNVQYTKADSSSSSDSTTTTQQSETTTVTTTTTTTTEEDESSGTKISTGAIIGIVAAAAVIIAVVAILIAKKKKPTEPAEATVSGGFTPPVPPVNNDKSAPPAEGSEGTTVLSNNASDPNATTVLGASAASAYLLRTSNNEKIYITKPYFKLGKDASRVDYCITGNPAVSRFHASIVSKNGQYFIVDNSTTNHTYVNDSMIPANVETQISNGAKIKLADEKFEFKI